MPQRLSWSGQLVDPKAFLAIRRRLRLLPSDSEKPPLLPAHEGFGLDLVVIVAHEVEQSMNDEEEHLLIDRPLDVLAESDAVLARACLYLGGIQRDGNVAEQAAGGLAGEALLLRKRKHIRGAVDPSMAPVEYQDLEVVRKQNREIGLSRFQGV